MLPGKWIAVIMVSLQFGIGYLFSRLPNIKIKRGTAIGGWFALTIDSFILHFYGDLPFVNATVAFLLGIISLIGVSVVFSSALAPHIYFNKTLKALAVGFTDIGIALNMIMAVLKAFLG